ncbi:signaling protein [[Clostridium] sordellii]|uniref:Signaling protein n=1 Tax=Paraclostridium sordellii TaxID=1505 RepID=A0ABM9RQ45_PARSO|nr:diguanylate cyclase [Paeniclostridium sordellii]CEJ74174.1 putative signaling protein [[Clostridium] sordellii] [Paeniclostridium sordellii]CEN69718.1 signaling protein [[Clostridium] sordellii] [Paeniclostridium sordellii]CEN72986.1 signaling protein [[Clostridium] sordellii] [Paeniclostridium sordellii]CEO25447.1 signaling protein [[Clostridium] sordellii] [Paeniclostridium sordellii]CEP75421.1 signaling protein [[Clostridium] sordellii] [Paeniclostridium sordellii]
MNRISKKIDGYFLGLILELFIITMLFIFNSKFQIQSISFVMFCITFFNIMITYTGGIILGLIATSIAIFIYAAYIFYISLNNGVEITYISYLWMIFMPIVSYTTGKFTNNINNLQKSNVKLEREYENLVTIHEDTGLLNVKAFYMNLEREISKAKRHKTELTLMLVKLPYYKETKKILGESKTNKLMKDISNVITKSTRIEDERYTIENDTIAIIMPNTGEDGANIVKERIKIGISDISLSLKNNKNYISIDTKIAAVEYKKDIKSPIEYKTYVQEELQYDV